MATHRDFTEHEIKMIDKRRVSQVIDRDKALYLSDEHYEKKDGTIIADCEMRHCGHSRGEGRAHRKCKAIYTIQTCGCVRRSTLHFEVSRAGDIVKTYYEKCRSRGIPDYYCPEHKIFTRRYIKNQ